MLGETDLSDPRGTNPHLRSRRVDLPTGFARHRRHQSDIGSRLEASEQSLRRTAERRLPCRLPEAIAARAAIFRYRLLAGDCPNASSLSLPGGITRPASSCFPFISLVRPGQGRVQRLL